VRQERAFFFNTVRNYAGDEGRPLVVGLLAQASNNLNPRWLKALVVSVLEKVTETCLLHANISWV
jgi:hypothetical protein